MALLAWAERHGAAIIEDDYDSQFRFSGRPIEPLQTLDRDGRVIYVGTFSKVMLPTLRLAFVVAPPSIRHAVRPRSTSATGTPPCRPRRRWPGSSRRARSPATSGGPARSTPPGRPRSWRSLPGLRRDARGDPLDGRDASCAPGLCRTPGRRPRRSPPGAGDGRRPLRDLAVRPGARRRGRASSSAMERSRGTGSRRAWPGLRPVANRRRRVAPSARTTVTRPIMPGWIVHS